MGSSLWEGLRGRWLLVSVWTQTPQTCLLLGQEETLASLLISASPPLQNEAVPGLAGVQGWLVPNPGG